jgi:hypothetical protein
MELENDHLADLSSDALRPDAHRRRWQWQSPLGLLLVGFGASLLGQATLMKRDAADGAGSTWAWVAAGTASLVALNAGLSLFGDAVKHRSLFEMTARLNREKSDSSNAS